MTHPPLDPFDPDCPTRQVLDRIAGKWAVLIVVALEPRAKRFGELRREVGGISQKMLTQTLRGLERDGLALRRVKPSSPVTVEYELTRLGRGLVPVLAGLTDWAVAAMPEIEEARSRFVSPGSEG
ncbi:MAG: Transcriptional regulator, HxlR family [uncultured Rubrobacteraceae bacterium]|uniref:Transcriptional regulator, HxlR family n=1 Tax=uncultured Rubrobacteraceae bacterium TaxID=349277 RepID=A0A6J4QN20_9ACTN|nr:MAG: Transcriptional regulator, HxlR family [uncultured Rubrobacteraceae bacterium]